MTKTRRSPRDSRSLAFLKKNNMNQAIEDTAKELALGENSKKNLHPIKIEAMEKMRIGAYPQK
jgi:hypothetical protein